MTKPTVLAPLFFLLGILTRLPFTSQILYHWDSVQFAVATDVYNIQLDQPQRPGYILYVALGKLLNLVTHDPQTSFVALSILFTGFAAAGIYLLARKMFDNTTGIVAGAFFLASPLVWFFGEITMPHVLEAFFVILIGFLFYQVAQGDESRLIPAAIAFGVAGGVRQTTLLFIMPLALYAVRRVCPKRLVVAAALFVVVCLAWFLSMAYTTGGVADYFNIFIRHNNADFADTSLFSGGLAGTLSNTDKFVRYLLFALNVMVLPPLLLAFVERSQVTGWIKSLRVQFLLVWALPACLFYIVVIMGNQGLLMVFLPALILLSARCLVLLVQLLTSDVRVLAGAAAVLVILSASLFLVAPENLPITNNKILSYNTLQNHDASVQTRVNYIRANFDPQQTVILATEFRHAQYYLPEYPVLWIPALAGEGTPKAPVVHFAYRGRYTLTHWSPSLLPPDIKTIVFYDTGVTDSIPASPPTRDIALPTGDHLTRVEILPGEQYLLGRNYLSLTP